MFVELPIKHDAQPRTLKTLKKMTHLRRSHHHWTTGR